MQPSRFIRKISRWTHYFFIGWVLCVFLFALPAVQRHIFYLHKAPIWWGQELDIPESFGFLDNQVLPLNIETSESCRLFAWLITPLALYAKHEQALVAKTRVSDDDQDQAIRLLQDPDSLLVIYFHGNGGTVGMSRRTDTYRMVSSGSPQRIHVLAFDYRGFGRSTGTPTEAGLIEDALSVIRWATTIGKVPTNRILLLGQSLGTAVVTGALEALVKQDLRTDFAGVMLCAPFAEAASAIMSYKLLGLLPMLAPLARLDALQAWFIGSVRDQWNTKDRLRNIMKSNHRLRLTMLAATSDMLISSGNTNELFDVSVEAASQKSSLSERSCKSQLGLEPSSLTEECGIGTKTIKKVIIKYGGHNGIMKWGSVALEVLKMFESADT
ncbi:alpha/beta-hydrolase [Myriangium duriaei CBS 260.36]|uniref:Alpha/beta-hydrolase n=1 Tax=Myriangium duriaei CBS 260.36 TaxID=1168546 RepID=A0A9P4IZW1_9PEZI|nr:alpha/beta-hydrolase [Myriangium duriaei CBS 260.36]